MSIRRGVPRGLAAVVAAGVVAVTAAAGQASGTASTGSSSVGAPTDAVTAWNANAVDAAVAACLSPANHPLLEVRLYALMHLAIHDALNAIDRHFASFVPGLARTPGASPQAAVASAARNVLVPELRALPSDFAGCIPAAVQLVEDDYSSAVGAIPAGSAKSQGIDVGERAAAAIVANRDGDGSDTAVTGPCPTSTDPGVYQCTPGTPFVFAPGWGGVKPFVLRDATQFRPGPPPALTSSRFAKDFNEIKRLGGDGVTTPSARTADQTQIALFWLESSPSQWNRIARTVSSARSLDLWENARLFALLNVAMSDGYVGTFETKYHYNFWRPVTAIRAAATDGNPATDPDPSWTPLETNPPIPDYDSGHSVEGGAAAEVMQRVFGRDGVTFKACSLTLPTGSNCGEASQVLRRYTSFSAAAAENGLSRILVGFHFRTAVNIGIDHGRKIGDRAVDKILNPTH